jgi:type IV secretory pathway TrbL component
MPLTSGMTSVCGPMAAGSVAAAAGRSSAFTAITRTSKASSGRADTTRGHAVKDAEGSSQTSPDRTIPAARAASRTTSVTSCPAWASRAARAQPMAPAPTIAKRIAGLCVKVFCSGTWVMTGSA